MRPGRITERRRTDQPAEPRRGAARTLTGRRMLLFGIFVLAALAFLYFVLPQLGRREAHLGPPQRRRRVVDRGGGDRGGRVDGQLHRDLPGRARAEGLADPLAPQLPDHDGGAGGDAPVRRGRRGRGGGDGVVAAALGHGEPRGGAADDRLPRAAVRGVHGGAGRVRRGPVHGRVPRPAPVCDHDRPGDRGRGGPGGDRRAGPRAARSGAASEPAGARRKTRIGRQGGAPAGGGLRRPPRRRRMARASPCRSCATRNGRCWE